MRTAAGRARHTFQGHVAALELIWWPQILAPGSQTGRLAPCSLGSVGGLPALRWYEKMLRRCSAWAGIGMRCILKTMGTLSPPTPGTSTSIWERTDVRVCVCVAGEGRGVR